MGQNSDTTTFYMHRISHAGCFFPPPFFLYRTFQFLYKFDSTRPGVRLFRFQFSNRLPRHTISYRHDFVFRFEILRILCALRCATSHLDFYASTLFALFFKKKKQNKKRLNLKEKNLWRRKCVRRTIFRNVEVKVDLSGVILHQR